MSGQKVRIGLTLPNRGVLFGATTVAELLDLSALADSSGYFDSVWVGDSILAKPRAEAITLLSAIAARTKRVPARAHQEVEGAIFSMSLKPSGWTRVSEPGAWRRGLRS